MRHHDAVAPLLMGAFALLIATQLCARLGVPGLGRLTVPLLGVLLTIGAGRYLAHRHADEPWLPAFLLAGVGVKLAASAARYWILVAGYEGIGDADDYSDYGRQFVAGWFGGGDVPVLDDMRKTNFVRWFTGAVYAVFGTDMLVGFFVFGLLGFVGSYLWYRATVEAVPFVDRRLYLALVLFAPSVAFWPSSIGKESLMQLGIGSMAFAVALGLQGRIARAATAGVLGGWLLFTVRPHLLAIATVAGAAAFIIGRRGPRREPGGSFGRMLGTIAMIVLAVFAVNAAAKALGMEDLSIDAIEAELNETTTRTAHGGSEFKSGDEQLTPLDLPRGAVTVLTRPYPWEVESGFQIIASLEAAALVVLMVARWRSLALSVRYARAVPFLLYCWVFLAVYVTAFSSFANFGLLVRQRSLALAALFVLVSVDVRRAPTSWETGDPDGESGAGESARLPSAHRWAPARAPRP